MFSHGHNTASQILSTGKPLALRESIRPTAHCNNYGTKEISKKGRKAAIAGARTQAKRDSYVNTIGG
ncbi:hypothetical protein SAMN05660293_01551 [Dyadobacter psychrophilus]|uniref:Uncharacterized protein n=1 Tax=Dyadobacter psychrophilus TaxID=651661 RepID=A0A1T5DDK2_9BACT|nr:hypothetical protein SAMN05660293_01551 [Dyadobacter psychrophilus]